MEQKDRPVITLWAVYRIHWLRAKARHDRWNEELMVTGYEMVWTRRYFEDRAHRWQKIIETPAGCVTQGHRCYALRQVAFWSKLASVSWSIFKQVNQTVDRIFGA